MHKITYNDFETKEQKIAFLKAKLAEDRQWAIKGLLRIYGFQTATEQAAQVTADENGVGFTGVDAKILSSFAEQYKKRNSLSPKQLAILFKKMPKYAGQLYKIVEGKL